MNRSIPLDPARSAAAVIAGDRFLADTPSTPPRDDYHRAVLAALGLPDPPASLLAELNRPLQTPFLELYAEVIRVLDEVRRRGVPMADRLRTRFAWGLLADIEPPELEVRIAILRKTAAVESVSLPDDVAMYIASSIKSQAERRASHRVPVLRSAWSSDKRAPNVVAVTPFIVPPHSRATPMLVAPRGLFWSVRCEIMRSLPAHVVDKADAHGDRPGKCGRRSLGRRHGGAP